MNDCLIAFGSNQGDSADVFAKAQSLLNKIAGVRVVAVSSAHQTEAVGGPTQQPAYLNAAIRVDTKLAPAELHRRLVEIEQKLGRRRRERWGARRVDLDLLLFGEQVVTTKDLIVPHPRMSFRKFVLLPAVEIAGEMLHPVCHLTIHELVDHLELARPEVVWVTENLLAAKKVVASLDESESTFQFATPKTAGPKFGRLLIYDVRDPGTEYCMPELNLIGCDTKRKQVEVAAALQAMK